MNITQFNEQEFEDILDQSAEVGISIDSNIQSTYECLLFLGASLAIDEDDLLELAVFNIRLCYVYFKRREEYEKVAELIKITHLIDQKSKQKQIVDNDVIDSIAINLN